ncbi:MAG: hypothetical protein WBX20_20590, partial [Terrimicrobiaceae bacterium]
MCSIETHVFGIRLPANAPEGQKRFPVSSWALLALLVLATTAKFAAFAHALSFGYVDGKVGLGLAVSVVQAGLWWWMARGLGIAGVLGAWLLQSLYLTVCWSYFAYFGPHLMFGTAVSVGAEGMTAVSPG